MNVYSSVDLLGKEIAQNNEKKLGLRSLAKSFIESYRRTVSLNIQIPTNVFLRTKQLCAYIESEVGVRFDLSNFIMALYLDFINSSIVKHDISTIFKILSKNNYTHNIKIVCGGDVWEGPLSTDSTTELIISMKKDDVLRGELLLAEIDDLYNYVLSIEETLSIIWVTFIRNYLKESNKKTLNAIINILRNSLI